MFNVSSTPFQSVLSSQALPGTWKLAAGRALTLKPRADAELRAAHGGLWITLDVPPVGSGQASGDIFLAEGECLTLAAGRVAVIEPWNTCSSSPTYFGWDAIAARVPAPVTQADPWQLGVKQPLADMREGALQTLGAFASLLVGLAGVLAASMPHWMLAIRLRKA